MSENSTFSRPGAARALFFSTTAFAVSFAVWGLVAALAPTFTQAYGLSAKSKSLMIAIPSCSALWDGFPQACWPTASAGDASSPPCAVPAIGIGLSTSYTQLLFLELFDCIRRSG